MPRTVILDVNETLSDTAALAGVLAGIGAGGVAPSAWLAATLRDGFALSLTTGARPFADVARQALAVLLSTEADLTGSVDDGVERVMAAFAELPVHADVPDGLRALAAAGHRIVTLSNGSADCTLVAVHPWDLHGARAAGLGTVHLDREGGAWPEAFTRPDLRIRALGDLVLP